MNESNDKRNDNPPEKLGKGKHKNPNSLKNLKPIKPGEVRNPNGWPKGKRHTDTLFELAMAKFSEALLKTVNNKRKVKKLKPLTLEQYDADPELDMWMKQVEKARNGDTKAFELISSYRHGKPKQSIELTGKDGNPIEYNIKIAEARQKLKDFNNKWFKQPTTTK